VLVIRITKKKSKFIEGIVTEVHTLSPERQAAAAQATEAGKTSPNSKTLSLPRKGGTDIMV
jgi:tRNA/tmRNA/rRNA uracil-C5-methylase (TrmA/RlmC/RlmD family)